MGKNNKTKNSITKPFHVFYVAMLNNAVNNLKG